MGFIRPQLSDKLELGLPHRPYSTPLRIEYGLETAGWGGKSRERKTRVPERIEVIRKHRRRSGELESERGEKNMYLAVSVGPSASLAKLAGKLARATVRLVYKTALIYIPGHANPVSHTACLIPS